MIYLTYWYGPMKSGKSAELIDQVQYGKRKQHEAFHAVLKLSPESILSKKTISDVRSRDGRSTPAIEGRFEDISAILAGVKDNQPLRVYVDEFQFISKKGLRVFERILENILDAKNNDVSFYISGLDLDFQGNYWTSHLFMCDCIPKNISKKMLFVPSYCEVEGCDKIARYSKRLSSNKALYDKDSEYQAVCEKHFGLEK